MWLTGFDAPCCHTMYVDKPMHGHNLMQAIARVNRVFKDKPGGLVVDYIGIAAELKNALRIYTDAKGKGQPTLKAEDALKILQGEARCRARHDARLRLQRIRDEAAGTARPGRESHSRSRRTARSASST